MPQVKIEPDFLGTALLGFLRMQSGRTTETQGNQSDTDLPNPAASEMRFNHIRVYYSILQVNPSFLAGMTVSHLTVAP